MGIKLISDFTLRSKAFLDDRVSIDKIKDLKDWDFSTVGLPEGFEVYCAEDSKWYIYNNATEDPETGKFRPRTADGIEALIHSSTGESSIVIYNKRGGAPMPMAMGRGSFAIGGVEEGKVAAAIGDWSFAFGKASVTTGSQCFSVGGRNVIGGDHSFGFGGFNEVDGIESMALGFHNTISANSSTVMGTSNSVNGLSSNVFGFNNRATHTNTLIAGRNLNSHHIDSLVFGKYNNLYEEDDFLVIGGGTAENDRTNLLKLKRNGDFFISGKFSQEGVASEPYDVINKQYIDDHVLTKLEFSDAMFMVKQATLKADNAAAAAKSVADVIKGLGVTFSANESKRIAAETKRADGETARRTKEDERVSSEQARQSAEVKRQADTSKAVSDCDEAAEDAREATIGLTDRDNSIGNLKWMNGDMVEGIPFDKDKHVFWNGALSVAWDCVGWEGGYILLKVYSSALRKNIVEITKGGTNTYIRTLNKDGKTLIGTLFNWTNVGNLQTRHNIICLDFNSREAGGFECGKLYKDTFVSIPDLSIHQDNLNWRLTNGDFDSAVISFGLDITSYKSFLGFFNFRMTDVIANDLCKRGLYFTEQVPLYRRGDFAGEKNVIKKYTTGWGATGSGASVVYSEERLIVTCLAENDNFYITQGNRWAYKENIRNNSYRCKLIVKSGSIKPRGFLMNGRANIIVVDESGSDVTGSFLGVGTYYMTCYDYKSTVSTPNDQYVFNSAIPEEGCEFELSELFIQPMCTFLQCVVKDVANNYINVNNEDYYPFIGDATPNDMIKPALYGAGTPSIKADFISQLYVNTEDGSAYVAKDVMSNVWKKITE